MIKLCLAASLAVLSLSIGSPASVRAAEKAHEASPEVTPHATKAKAEEPGERARRLLDEQAERLEAEARRVTRSICRGC